MSEESKKFYRHALSIEVDYWASNSQQASNLLGAAEKTKVVVPHHSLPCILSWDEENTISVWDYEAKKLVWSRTLVQLVAELARGHEISKPSKGSQSFVSSRAQSRGSAHAQLSNRSPSIPNKSSLTGEANAMGKNTHQFGELREVDFADKLSIAYRGGIANLPSESEIRYEHRLLLRFDTTIVLYNIFTNRFTMITANDLITKKIASCAFLSNDCLAVGCHDGNLKIWNIKRKLIERVFSVGQKDVTYINTIPLDR